MDKRIDFKEFVKSNPSLITHVRNNTMTWQKFYELFDLYGSDHEIWNDYIKKATNTEVKTAAKALGFADVLAWMKNIDLDSFQESINSVQRVVGVLQDFGTKDTTATTTSYKPRPVYKHFED